MFNKSKSEARRLIKAGAFNVNGIKIINPKQKLNLKVGDVIQLGREAIRIVP